MTGKVALNTTDKHWLEGIPRSTLESILLYCFDN